MLAALALAGCRTYALPDVPIVGGTAQERRIVREELVAFDRAIGDRARRCMQAPEDPPLRSQAFTTADGRLWVAWVEGGTRIAWGEIVAD